MSCRRVVSTLIVFHQTNDLCESSVANAAVKILLMRRRSQAEIHVVTVSHESRSRERGEHPGENGKYMYCDPGRESGKR
jgi:hypothetical protein